MNRRSFLEIGALLASPLTSVNGQSSRFGVAAIHLTPQVEVDQRLAPSRSGGPGTADPLRIRFSRMPLAVLISMAFEVEGDSVVGTQPVLHTFYDITASVEPGSRKEDVPAMLKALLEERFALKTHVERRSKALDRIVIAKGGAKLTPSRPASVDSSPGVAIGAADNEGFPSLPPSYSGVLGRTSNGRMLLRGQNATVGELAKWLGPALGRAVVDGTGLPGKYDFKLAFRSTAYSGNPSAPAQDDNDPTETVLQGLADLGLRVESASESMDYVVVDNVNKEPTPN